MRVDCALRVTCISPTSPTSFTDLLGRPSCFERCRWSIWGCRRSLWTAFQKLHQTGHLMVPLWSVSHANMCGTALVAVGRNRSPRSSGATSLHMGLEVYLLVAAWAFAWPYEHVRGSSVGHFLASLSEFHRGNLSARGSCSPRINCCWVNRFVQLISKVFGVSSWPMPSQLTHLTVRQPQVARICIPLVSGPWACVSRHIRNLASMWSWSAASYPENRSAWSVICFAIPTACPSSSDFNRLQHILWRTPNGTPVSLIEDDPSMLRQQLSLIVNKASHARLFRQKRLFGNTSPVKKTTSH